MKKKLTLILFCVVIGIVSVKAQVRIGGTTAPNQSAVLDLNPTNTGTTDKALVLPRVNLQETTTQTLKEVLVGMTVYNVATANDVTPGVYFWNGTKWVRVGDAAETLTTLVNKNNGSYSYINEDSTETILDIKSDIYNYGDTLLSNNQFVTNLGDTLLSNNQFVTNLGDTLLNNNQFVTNFGDTLLNNNQFVTNLGDTLLNNNQFITNISDSIANNIYNTTLGDSILSYITNNATQELTDSIMSNVTIKGENGITVTGSGTSDITIGLPAGNENGQILVWDGTEWVVSSDTAIIKRIEFIVDASATDSVQSRVLEGTSTTTTKDIQIISVRPEIITSGGFDEADLSISTTAKVVGDAITWTVRVANENYEGSRKFGVAKVVVYYLCEESLNKDTLNSRKYIQPIVSVKYFE